MRTFIYYYTPEGTLHWMPFTDMQTAAYSAEYAADCIVFYHIEEIEEAMANPGYIL